MGLGLAMWVSGRQGSVSRSTGIGQAGRWADGGPTGIGQVGYLDLLVSGRWGSVSRSTCHMAVDLDPGV